MNLTVTLNTIDGNFRTVGYQTTAVVKVGALRSWFKSLPKPFTRVPTQLSLLQAVWRHPYPPHHLIGCYHKVHTIAVLVRPNSAVKIRVYHSFTASFLFQEAHPEHYSSYFISKRMLRLPPLYWEKLAIKDIFSSALIEQLEEAFMGPTGEVGGGGYPGFA